MRVGDKSFEIKTAISHQTRCLQVPHVSSCRSCMTCHEKQDGSSTSSSLALHSVEQQSAFAALLKNNDASLQPDAGVLSAGRSLPDCNECYGCSASLRLLESVDAYGRKWKVERGGSPEWIFYAGVVPDAKGTETFLRNFIWVPSWLRRCQDWLPIWRHEQKCRQTNTITQRQVLSGTGHLKRFFQQDIVKS